jgi:hypothetical protein
MTGKRRAGRGPAEPPQEPRPPSSPLHESMVIAPVVSRRQARAERRRQQRRRFGFAGGSAIAIGAIVVVALVAFGVNKAVTSGGGGTTRSQTTVLLQITGTGGAAITSALLAHDTGNNSGSEVLIPSRVLTNVCGYNSLDFGDILSKPDGETVSRQALSAMLSNITIDGSWLLSTTQLASLIDALGGVTVDVDVDVVQHTGGGGGRILVAAGSQRHLSGAQAVEYATYTASANEDAALQLARLQQVIDATALALPPSATGIAARLRSLGASGESTLGATKLSSFLVGFAAAERGTGTLLPTDLPTTIIDSGGAPSYSIDTSGAAALVNSHLSASLPADAGTHRTSVYLLNGVGSPGLVATTCARLAAKDITYAGSRNAATFNHPTSSIVVSNANIPLGYEVADALNLPHSDVLRSSSTQTIADVIVTLGGDYRP